MPAGRRARLGSRLILAGLEALLLSSAALATDLVVGTETRIDYNGTYQEFTIPSGITTPAELDLFLKGGDGGKRVVPGLCKYKGGRGAKVFARFTVGTGAGELRPGSRIRFIVGNQGDNNRSNNIVGAGGGGGTAVLYTTATTPGCYPSTTLAAGPWVILGAAGGGGGAYTSGLCGGQNGTGGQATENGTSGTGDDSFRGEDGNGGQNGGSHEDCFSGGPGGGALTPGVIIDSSCADNLLNRAGGAGLCTGAGGGIYPHGPDGGFGYGGGGSGSKVGPGENAGGGGGGGYSGGGGGEFFGRGGGGGSFLSAAALTGSYKENGGQTSTPDPGYVTYTLGPPTNVVAICKDVTLDLGSDGTATLLTTDVDAGSIFPDVTGYTPTHELRINKGSIPDLFSSETSLAYGCSDLGDGHVSLLALLKDGSTINDSDTCVASITVRDSRDFTLSGLSDVTVTADGDTCSTTVTSLPVPSAQGLCPGLGVTLTYQVDLSPAGGTSSTLPYTDGELDSLALDVGSATVHYTAESDGRRRSRQRPGHLDRRQRHPGGDHE